MAGELFLYIATVSSAIFYIVEFNAIKTTYTNLYIVESKKDNIILNFYSIRLRCCSIITNICYIEYNHVNNLEAAVIQCSLFLFSDFVILLTRLYYLYVLQFQIKESNENCIDNNDNESIENPIQLQNADVFTSVFVPDFPYGKSGGVIPLMNQSVAIWPRTDS